MTEETTPDSPKDIKMEVIARDQSKVVQIGSVEAENFYLKIERLESSSSSELAGIVKAGNPHTTLAYWQGRSEEITQVTQWLEDKNINLIGIEGIGGTGKSMLAAKIYEEIEGLPKRYWADVSSGAVFSDLARRVLTEFGHRVPELESELVEALVKCLQSGQYLLIIDNLESLLQQERQWGSQFYSDFFISWVESGYNSKVLVTTRERPQQPTSSKFQWVSLKGLKVEEGVALLTALGIGGDKEAFTTLADGHPLLLRLVADLLIEEYPQDPSLGRLAELGLENLQQILTDPLVVGQHRRENVGMVLVLDASFARLSDLQKRLLLNVSVYRGTFNKEAAAALLLESSKTEVERELRILVKRSFLLEKLNSQRWFNFQPVVLEYVRYKAGDQIEVHQRAISFYLLNVKQKPWHTVEDIKEYLEIFYHLYQLEQYDSAFDVLRACDDFLTLRGYYTVQVELRRQLIAAWEKTGVKENWNYQDALIGLGNAYQSLGQYQRAIEFLQQSLNTVREIGNRKGERSALGNLGIAYNSLGQYQQAIKFYQQSLNIAREIGDHNGEGSALGNIGVAYQFLGEYQRAIEFQQQSLNIFREIGDHNGEGSALCNIGNAYESLGEYQRAIEFQQQSLNIFKEIGNRKGEGSALGGIGLAYESLGQYQRAIEFLQQSLNIFREIGDRNGEGSTLGNIGLAYQSLGQYQRAIEFQQQWLNIAREIGDHNGEGSALGNIGVAYQSLRQYQRAIEFQQQWLNIAREIGNRNGEGNALGNIGNVYQSLGQHQRAIEFLQQWLNIAREIGNRKGEGSALGGIGNAYKSLRQYQQAIEFHQQSLNIAREIGNRKGEGSALSGIGLAYESLGQYQQAIEFYQQSLNIFREIGNRHGEGSILGNIGLAYQSLGQYQQAIEFHQQSLDIAREIGDHNGEGRAWFNLGLSLEKINRESDALSAYRNASELYQAMELNTKVQDCNNAIERLLQKNAPVAPKQGFWGWLGNLW